MPVKRNAPTIDDYMDPETKKKGKKARYDEDPVEEPEIDEEDVEEEEETPKKKAKKAKKEKKAKKPVEKPSKTSRRRDEEDDEEEEDADELPRRSSVVQRGWKAARERMDESFTDDFKFSEDEQIVKFLDPEPLTYSQHWLTDRPEGKKKSFICLEKGCPLCDELGDTPSPRFAFSVVNLSLDGMPVQRLVAGVRLANSLEKLHKDRIKGPLDKAFYALSKTGEKLSTVHQVSYVKGRDLDEDYGIDPKEVEEALENREPLTPEKAVPTNSADELQEVADEFA